jgi:VanZ family protein
MGWFGSWNSERRMWLTAYAPLVVWIGVILFLGSGQGSMTRTSIIVRPLLEFLFPLADEATLQIYHGYIRKMAHLFEYAVLAFLALRAFRSRYVYAIVVVIVIASLDECLQSFNASRTSSIYDVFIDISGGLLVMFTWFLCTRYKSPA